MLSNSARHTLQRHFTRTASFRGFSSYYAGGGSSGQVDDPSSIRSYPQYSVYGERCVLAIKMIPPTLQVLKSRTLVVEKKGRLLLEWIPRAPDGTVLRDSPIIRFGLSPEEVGLVLDQLPQHQVELTRQPPRNFNEFAPVSQPTATKVLTVTPQGSGGVIAFKVQFEDDSSSFIEPRTGGNAGGGAQEVLVQLGEFQVMRQLMQSSIPLLVGWQQQVEIALEWSIDSARRNQGQPMARSSSSHDIPF